MSDGPSTEEPQPEEGPTGPQDPAPGPQPGPGPQPSQGPQPGMAPSPQGAPTPQGPGWWQASDGLFYPPQPGAPMPPKKSGAGKGCLIALAAVGGFFVLIVIVAIVAAVGSSDGDDDAASDSGSETTEEQAPDEGSGDDPNPGELFPDRPDTQSEDQEREIGDSARLSGYTTTVDSAEFVQSVSDFEDAGYVRIGVTVVNRDDSAQPYNLFDWVLQTPGGQVLDPALVTVPTLDSGDLVGGGEVTGDVYFEVGDQTGEFFIVYKPDAFDAARGVWSVTV